MDPVRLVVYSDYLCPWCYNAAHRLARLREELGDHLELEWRSFLLRPAPASRELLDFVRYTRSWLRPASEPDAPRFHTWESGEGPPSHSVPPHLVAKAAARLGEAAFEDVHARLLRAYFGESRDITSRDVLRGIWEEAGLPLRDLEAADAPETRQRVLAEHREAVERGITGVPTTAVAGTDAAVVGAQPLAVYRRWVDRLRAGVLD